MQERLDRGFANYHWRELFPLAEVRIGEVTTSDHVPLHLTMNTKVYVPKKKRFRFENVWIKEQECLNVVKNSWEYTEGKDILDKIGYYCLKLEEWGGGQNQVVKRRLRECREAMRKCRARRDAAGI